MILEALLFAGELVKLMNKLILKGIRAHNDQIPFINGCCNGVINYLNCLELERLLPYCAIAISNNNNASLYQEIIEELFKTVNSLLEFLHTSCELIGSDHKFKMVA